jgi:hypothetical protein
VRRRLSRPGASPPPLRLCSVRAKANRFAPARVEPFCLNLLGLEATSLTLTSPNSQCGVATDGTDSRVGLFLCPLVEHSSGVQQYEICYQRCRAVSRSARQRKSASSTGPRTRGGTRTLSKDEVAQFVALSSGQTTDEKLVSRVVNTRNSSEAAAARRDVMTHEQDRIHSQADGSWDGQRNRSRLLF